MDVNRALVALAALPLAVGAGWAATADTAERQAMVQATDTLPPPDIRALVNGLPYEHYNPGPAMDAFRLVAAYRGWPDALIKAWEPFVNDVMFGESAYCWNRQRGDIMIPHSMCVLQRGGRHEDVGFGQVTAVFYGQNGEVCKQYGYCSRQQILASPFDSMLASIVAPIELEGSQPWCYNAYARRYHDCWRAPDR